MASTEWANGCLHKYRIGFQPPKEDAAGAVEPYLWKRKTARVCKVASLV
jgi:hypothetical protein